MRCAPTLHNLLLTVDPDANVRKQVLHPRVSCATVILPVKEGRSQSARPQRSALSRTTVCLSPNPKDVGRVPLSHFMPPLRHPSWPDILQNRPMGEHATCSLLLLDRSLHAQTPYSIMPIFLHPFGSTRPEPLLTFYLILSRRCQGRSPCYILRVFVHPFCVIRPNPMLHFAPLLSTPFEECALNLLLIPHFCPTFNFSIVLSISSRKCQNRTPHDSSGRFCPAEPKIKPNNQTPEPLNPQISTPNTLNTLTLNPKTPNPKP